MVTIYDIAREAGISASSVSRVINNKPGVNKDTRKKIQDLLEKYHYVPNEAARGLVMNNSRLVGILLADVRILHHIEGAYHISHELEKQEYCSLIINAGRSEEEMAAALGVLEKRKVEAVVLMGSIFQTELVRRTIQRSLSRIPVFMLNGYLDLPNVVGVLADERAGVRNCVQLLADKGRRNIAFLVDQLTPSSLLKEEGYREGMRALKRGRDRCWIYENVDGSLAGGHETMLRVLDEHPDLDGVICSLDIIGCGVLDALRERRISVPQQVSVIGIDNSTYSEICTPKMTSLDNMIFQSSVMIAHKLTDCLNGVVSNQKTILITDIVERETT